MVTSRMAAPKQGAMEDEFLSCPICYDIFKEPKTLSCLHRFCQECLHNFIQRHKTTAITRQRGFNCPVCREFIRAPDPSRPPAEWAALFKTDFHMKNLIKYVEARSGRQLNRPANPCSLHGHAECDLYCVDCQMTICHLCAGISHRGCSRVLTVAEAARDRRAAAGECVKELTAKLKEANDLERSREKCLDNFDNQKAAAEKAISNMVKELHSRIKIAEDKLRKKLKDDFESIHGKITVKVVQFENELSELREKVHTFNSDLESISDTDILRATSLPEVAKIQNAIDIKSHRRFLANVASIKIVLDKQSIPAIHLGEITIKRAEDELLPNNLSSPPLGPTPTVESRSLLERIRGIGKKPEAVYYAPADLNVREGDQLARQPSLRRKATVGSNLKRNIIGVPPDGPAENGSAVLTFNNLRRNEERITESHQTHRRPVPPMMYSSQGSEEPDSPAETHTSIAKLRTLNTRFREDKDQPKLRDLIVLQGNETVLVTDWANQCVKAIYSRRERDARLVLGGKPWAIAQISETLAAVSLPVSTQICVIKINPTLSVQNSFMLAKRYTGLASLSNSMLVASGGSDPPSVDIINLYGEVLKSFALDRQGLPMFEYPAYVCVTPAAMILVTDRNQGAVTCLTPTGDVKYRFQPEGSKRLKEPSGIVTDSTGRILVAESRGLLALTPTGEFRSILVGPNDGLLEDPRGVAVCTGGKDDLVFVTSADQNIEVLSVG